MAEPRRELERDVGFLLRRARLAGVFQHDEKRDYGMSSNAVVDVAYGIVEPEDAQLPMDEHDLAACERMWGLLPEHRKTDAARAAMERARAAVRPEEEVGHE